MKRLLLLFAFVVGCVGVGGVAEAEDVLTPTDVSEAGFSFDAFGGGGQLDLMDPFAVGERIREERAARLAALSSPAAAAEREDSIDAFEDLGARAAIDLTTGVFAEPLESLVTLPTDSLLKSESPPVFLDGSDGVARIDPPGPDASQLVVSSAPLRNEEGAIAGGELEVTGDGFQPQVPLAEVQIPERAGGSVELADVGVSFSVDGAANTLGRLVDVGSSSGREMVIYPNTATDTDSATTYTLSGVETFTYLRSAESPEKVRLTYDLPEGASLAETTGGGAEVTDSAGEVLVDIDPPFAVDAQGSDVPLGLTAEGNALTIDVLHRDGDFAYPIMVDPRQHIRDWNTNGSSPGFEGWSFYQSGTTNYNYSFVCPPSIASFDVCGSSGTGAGLYASGVPNSNYPAGSKAYWRWEVPGGADSYIASTNFSNWRWRRGGSSSGWGFVNVYNGQGYNETGPTTSGSSNLTGGTSSKDLHVGTMTNTSINPMPAGATNWRYMRLAAYTANLDDQYPPDLTLSEKPTNWMPANTAFTAKAQLKDTGLGVGWINTHIGASATNQWIYPCTGTYPSVCLDDSGLKTLNFNTNSFSTGTTTVYVKGYDILGKEDVETFDVKVDKVAPTLTVGAPLNSGTPLLGAYTEVPVSVTDSNSGFGQIQLKVDGTLRDVQQEVCGVSTCSTPSSVQMDLADVAAGSHTWQVIAADKAGNSTSVSGSFTLDPTAPLLSVTGPLPDSNALPLTTSTANALLSGSDSGTGNTGIKLFEVRVDDETPVQIPVSCPSGVCPSSTSDTYTYAKSVWGTGGRTVEFVAVDKAGNEAMRSFTINAPAPTPVDPTCPTTTVSTPSPVSVVTVNDAVDEIETEFPELIEGSGTFYDDESEVTLQPSLVPPPTSPVGTKIEIDGTDAGGKIAVADTGGFVNGGAHCFMPTTTTSAATAAAIVNGDSVVYANTAPQVDTVVRPSASGVQVAEVLRGSSSQTQFGWKTELGVDEELVELSNGGLAIVDTVEDNPDVPSPTPVSATLATSSDPEAQLAVSNYSIKLAQHETERFVKTVISPPIVEGAPGQVVSLTKTGTNTFKLTTTAQTSPSVVSFYSSSTLYHRSQENGRNICDRFYACFFRATQYYGRMLQFRRKGWPTNLAYYSFDNKTSSVRNRTDNSRSAIKLYDKASQDGTGDRANVWGASRCVFGLSSGISDLGLFNEKASGMLIRTTQNC